ncbi:MAG: hypothetical protein IPO65_18820, partial [Saprospiraceae bacterium]|nr:hypothetical protein [Saprospiraceae bacterium]
MACKGRLFRMYTANAYLLIDAIADRIIREGNNRRLTSFRGKVQDFDAYKAYLLENHQMAEQILFKYETVLLIGA